MWRLIFLIAVLYFLYRSVKNILFPGQKDRIRKKPEENEPFYQKITDQKIEDIEFEEVEPEDKE